MHTNQVALLLDLAQTHSFNQTAERLFTTQQNVSYSIRQLEKELQIQIFHRTKAGVFFTPEGEHVLQCAIEMQHSYDALQKRLAPTRIEETDAISRIRFCFSSILLSSVLPDIINDFYNSYPNIQLVIQEVSQSEILPYIFQETSDFTVWDVNQDYLEKSLSGYNVNELTIKALFRNKSIAVISANSPLAKRSSLSIDEMNRMSKSIFGLLPVDYYGKDLNSLVLYSSNNPAVHQQLINQQGSVCFTSERLYHRFFPEDSYHALPFDYPTLPNYMLILYQKKHWHPAFDALQSIIQKHLYHATKPSL